LAATHVSQLIRYEIDLAKTELRADLQRVGTAAGLGGFAFFLSCLVLVFLGFAEAYGLIAAGVWAWAAFLITAATCVVIGVAAALIAYLKVRRLSGLRLTRETVTQDLEMFREGLPPQVSPDGDRPGISRAGQQAGIVPREVK
jgi:hypothetical protein